MPPGISRAVPLVMGKSVHPALSLLGGLDTSLQECCRQEEDPTEDLPGDNERKGTSRPLQTTEWAHMGMGLQS